MAIRAGLLNRLVLLFGLSLPGICLAAPATYVQDNFIGSPSSPAQLIYSPGYGSLVLRTASSVRVMTTGTGSVTTFTPNSQFTDMSLTPDGRYVVLADYGVSAGRVGRIDLQTGTYDSKPVTAVPYRIEAIDSERFILASQDQWISYWLCGWGSGSGISVLNSNPNGFYASVYYGDIEYDPVSARVIHGNSGSSSHEVRVYTVVGNNFVAAEGTGTYGTADAYGGTSVLATDRSRFYYGRLQVLASDVRQNQLVFPANIIAATGNEAFVSGGTYYDAFTAAYAGSLGYPVTVYGLAANATDFWAYDPGSAMLRHFAPEGGPVLPDAHPDYISVAQGYAATIDILANDAGFGASAAVEIVTPPLHGTATVMGSPGDKAAIRVRYTATAGYVGPDSFEYSVSDGSNSDTARVGIDVVAAKAFNDSYVVLNGSSQSLHVARNDVGFGAQLTLSIVASPQIGSAYTSTSSGTRDSVSISYSPAYNRPAPYTDTFSYRITDGARADSAIVSVRVVDYAALDDEVVTGMDLPVSIDVAANDLGFGYGKMIGIYTHPLHGTVAIVNGMANYSPGPGYQGPDSFEYFIEDGARIAVAKVAVSIILDSDGDKVSDTVDNCLGQANADQRDSDGDGFGNWCDADLNNDNRVNFADLAIFRTKFGTSDPDADFDGNGSVGFSDLARLRALFGGTPGPSAVAP